MASAISNANGLLTPTPNSPPAAQALSGGNGILPTAVPPDSGLLTEISDEDLLRALIRRGKNPPGKLVFSSREEENQLVQQVLDNAYDSKSVIERFVRNITELWGNWRGVTEEKTFPFENCNNIRVPLTSVFIETTVMRLLKALTSSEFICKVNFIDKQIDTSELAEFNQWFKWELKTNVRFRTWCIDMLRTMLITGLHIAIPSYVNERRFLHSQIEFEPDPETDIKTLCEQALQQILTAPNDWGIDDPISVERQVQPCDFKLSDGGRIVFSLKLTEDNDLIGAGAGTRIGSLVADIWRNETIFNGVKINQVNLEDLIVPNTHQSIEDLPYWGVRQWWDVHHYRDAINNKFFLDLGDEENKRIMASATYKRGQDLDQPLTDMQDSEEGYDSTGSGTQTTPENGFIEVYRMELPWVWGQERSDDMIDRLVQPATHLAVWIAVEARRVIRIARLEDLNKNAKRSGVKFSFIEEPGRFFPMGLAEWVKHSQTEIDAIHNQRLDAGLLFNVPWGFYKPAVGMAKNAQPISIQPGKLSPVADPQGVNFPRPNWQPAFSFAEEGLVYKYATDQAGLSESAMGRPSSKRQSASEFVGIASAIELRTEGVLDTLLESIEEFLFRILGLYQQFGSRTRIYRVSGEGGVELTKRFSRDRLQGQLTLTMAGNISEINEQLKRQTAVDMMQLLLNQFLIQLGIVGPDTIYEAVKTLTRLQNYDVTLHKPQSPPMSDAPEVEEHQMFAGIKPTGPSMGENTQEHLHHHSMTLADSEVMNSWTPQARQLFVEHMQATLKLEQAQQVLAQQRAILATQMAGTMAEKGIRPGKQGQSAPNTGMGPGAASEGVTGGGANPAAPPVAQ